MTSLVTGSAGYIGSTLAARLLADGETVVGADRLPPHPAVAGHDRYTHVQGDLVEDGVPDLEGVDVVYHCAAATGIDSSWGEHFDGFVHDNVVATQRVLDACREAGTVRRVVYLGSGQAYGDGDGSAVREDAVPHPHSPYAVTKCAAEQLVGAYVANFGVPAVTTRLFYVVGPGQRDDVFVHRLISRALAGRPLELYANAVGARRDFVHVEDVVDAVRAAADPERDVVGRTVNVGSGVATPLADVVRLVGEIVGAEVSLESVTARPGYVSGAPATIDLAHDLLGWSPARSLPDALRSQVEWQRTA